MTDKPPSSSPSDTSEKLSRLRQTLRLQLDDFQKICRQLADSGPLIVGSYYLVYKTCSHEGCRCHKGEKHGPFPALSWTAEGKRGMVMVRAADTAVVERKAAAYKRYQKAMTRLRRLSSQIDATLQEIRTRLTEEYP